MKTLIKPAILFIIILMQSNLALSQMTTEYVSEAYCKYISDLTIKNPRKITKISSKKVSKGLSQLDYNPKMLNMFIANHINSILSNSKSISLQKFYAVLESDDESISLGYNITNRKNNIDRLKSLWNVGIKSNMENNFSKILIDKKFNPELSLNIKYTYFFKGSIYYNNRQSSILKGYRNNYLKNKYSKSLGVYNSSDSDPQKDENTELEVLIKYGSLTTKEKNETIENEFYTQYEKIATDEEKFISDNKLFNSVITKWVTFDMSLPVAENKYAISPAYTTFASEDKSFYNLKLGLTYNQMQKYSDKTLIHFAGGVGLINLNNITTNELKAYKYETISNLGNSNQTTINTKDVYVGTYKNAVTLDFKGEATYFFLKDIWGISLALEYLPGSLSTFNYKIGSPISLKDKDGKSTVNFEIQYKNLFNKNYFGLTVGLPFGKYIN